LKASGFLDDGPSYRIFGMLGRYDMGWGDGSDGNFSGQHVPGNRKAREISEKSGLSTCCRQLEHSDVGQIAVFALIVEPVAHDELVADFEAHVVGIHLRRPFLVFG